MTEFTNIYGYWEYKEERWELGKICDLNKVCQEFLF